jgi:tetratricopeptide (TPR) repeat protein
MEEEAERHFKHALKKYEERLARGADDPYTKYYVACLHSLRGDADKAIKYLEETFVHLRALNTIRARIEPDFDRIREDPRFLRLVGQ